MIPAEYSNFFTTMAGVEATLFGLIFVVISIAPAPALSSEGLLEKQINVLMSYSALLNPLIISLFALVPDEPIALIGAGMSLVGLVNTLAMLITWHRSGVSKGVRVRNGSFIVVGCMLYAAEAIFSTGLYREPADGALLKDLVVVLIVLSVFGVACAWGLVGVRRSDVWSALRKRE